MSKLLETLLLHQVIDPLDYSEPMDIDQFGFRPGHLTAFQPFKRTHYVATALKRNQTTGMVSLDLKKALLSEVKVAGF